VLVACLPKDQSMEKSIIIALIAIASLPLALVATKAAHADPITNKIVIVGVGDKPTLEANAKAGWIVRAGMACPPNVPGGIYGGAAGNGSGEHPVGCVIMQGP